jgi:putative Mg2+ transporter-C (MgtC) family protein
MAAVPYGDVFLRLAAAVVAGSLIGLDRERRRKPAGLRTVALVSLGSAAFVLAAIDGGGTLDPVSRVIQGVVTGVGFLGAGSIIRGRGGEASVRGLTTAASIWLAAGIGIACGTGNWPLAIGASLLGLLVLTLTPVERIIQHRSDDANGP